MDPLYCICREHGFFTRAWARESGYDDRSIAREVRSRRWTRLQRGYYCLAEIWVTLDPTERHLVRSRAVMHSLGDRVALSHASGCVLHSISTWYVCSTGCTSPGSTVAPVVSRGTWSTTRVSWTTQTWCASGTSGFSPLSAVRSRPAHRRRLRRPWSPWTLPSSPTSAMSTNCGTSSA